MDLTSYFTTGAFDSIVSEQNNSFLLSSGNYDENKALQEAAEKLKNETIISFEDLRDKGLICINEDSQSFTIITCAPKNSEIYKKLDKLYNSGCKFAEDKKTHLEIPNFEQIKDNKEFLERIKILMNINRDVNEIKNKLGCYVFNADNFFKMVQVLIRIKNRIPVILMGETGCGKTSLINALSDINNFKMVTLNIHAGVNDNEIVKFMVKNDLLENELNYDKFEDDIDEIYDCLSHSNFDIILSNKIEEKLIIVFFDEFNTCNSLGLLTEIMCNRRCQGVKIKDNVSFVAACNPYRILTTTLSDNSALIKDNNYNSNQKLVYSVNPLTYTQLYYVFNFGSLNAKTEREYITGIINEELIDYCKDQGIFKQIKQIMIDSFCEAHQFIKQKNGKESVSMRETRKFMNIYKFLIEDFRKKQFLSKTEKIFSYYANINESIAQQLCITTSIYICYYIRLSEPADKMTFENKMNSILRVKFLDYPKRLQDELISNIKLERGIAPNESFVSLEYLPE